MTGRRIYGGAGRLDVGSLWGGGACFWLGGGPPPPPLTVELRWIHEMVDSGHGASTYRRGRGLPGQSRPRFSARLLKLSAMREWWKMALHRGLHA
jgi:hypothetical protein